MQYILSFFYSLAFYKPILMNYENMSGLMLLLWALNQYVQLNPGL